MPGHPSYYLPAGQLRTRFGTTASSLRLWADSNLVRTWRTPNLKKRFYNVDDVKTLIGIENTPEKEKICYARVSSDKQRGDLERQRDELASSFPHHRIISDVGSGINWKRSGFVQLLEQVCNGRVSEIVVTHRDRLCRFAFELVEQICKKFGCRILVHSQASHSSASSTDELAEDLLAITSVFVARNNGIRAAANRRRRERTHNESHQNQAASDARAEGASEAVHGGSSLDVQSMSQCH